MRRILGSMEQNGAQRIERLQPQLQWIASPWNPGGVMPISGVDTLRGLPLPFGNRARLVQLDRMSAYGADGRRFESCTG